MDRHFFLPDCGGSGCLLPTAAGGEPAPEDLPCSRHSFGGGEAAQCHAHPAHGGYRCERVRAGLSIRGAVYALSGNGGSPPGTLFAANRVYRGDAVFKDAGLAFAPARADFHYRRDRRADGHRACAGHGGLQLCTAVFYFGPAVPVFPVSFHGRGPEPVSGAGAVQRCFFPQFQADAGNAGADGSPDLLSQFGLFPSGLR